MAKRQDEEEDGGIFDLDVDIDFSTSLQGDPCDPYLDVARCRDGHDEEKAQIEYCTKAPLIGTNYCEFAQ